VAVMVAVGLVPAVTVAEVVVVETPAPLLAPTP
jgi:hypothetical protein